MSTVGSRRKSLVFPGILIFVMMIASCSSSSVGGGSVDVPECDLVITGGRVIDPLTGFDDLAAVGILGDSIERIATDAEEAASLVDRAARVIDASGLVVSPGFINTHTHEGDIQESMKVFVKDGITTWIGGNCGASYHPLSEFYGALEADGIPNNYASLTGLNTLRSLAGLDAFEPATETEITEMVQMLSEDMEAGGMGISFGSYYGPGCTTEEMIATASEAAAHGGMAASHIRDNLFNLESLGLPNYILNAQYLQEAIDTARAADVPYIVSHLTDITYGNGTTGFALGSIAQAIHTEGLRMAVDVIGFDSFPNDFYTIIRYGTIPIGILMAMAEAVPSDFQVTEDVFIDGNLFMEAYEYLACLDQAETLLAAIEAGEAESPGVLCHIIKPANTMLALAEPFVFIGNDGAVTIDPDTGEPAGHPRSAGAFARFIGRWSRDHGVMNLMQALYKATAAPAVWFGLEDKGRLQEGADADIVVFDADAIIDRATTEVGRMLDPPEGISYVIVNGIVVVDQNDLTGEMPGEPIRRTWAVPGIHAGLDFP
ncbi:amidohydrolase family protein [Thermodesulfobacteriota bacterium]